MFFFECLTERGVKLPFAFTYDATEPLHRDKRGNSIVCRTRESDFLAVESSREQVAWTVPSFTEHATNVYLEKRQSCCASSNVGRRPVSGGRGRDSRRNLGCRTKSGSGLQKCSGPEFSTFFVAGGLRARARRGSGSGRRHAPAARSTRSRGAEPGRPSADVSRKRDRSHRTRI